MRAEYEAILAKWDSVEDHADVGQAFLDHFGELDLDWIDAEREALRLYKQMFNASLEEGSPIDIFLGATIEAGRISAFKEVAACLGVDTHTAKLCFAEFGPDQGGPRAGVDTISERLLAAARFKKEVQEERLQ